MILFTEYEMTDSEHGTEDARCVRNRVCSLESVRAQWGELVEEAIEVITGAAERREELGTKAGDEKPLTRAERALVEVLSGLPESKGLTGMELIEAMAKAGVHGITQSSLTSRIIGKREKRGLRGWAWDIPNRRGVGYYLSVADRRRFERITSPRSV